MPNSVASQGYARVKENGNLINRGGREMTASPFLDVDPLIFRSKEKWYTRQDSNLRHPASKAGALSS